MPIPAEVRSQTQPAPHPTRNPLDDIVQLAFAAAIVTSITVFVLTRSQPILEWFGFRQAQTALTAYWFMREGFTLTYQTPVLGYPWPIPLEFPLFQALAAAIASLSKYPLDQVGRALSFAFFLATLVPIASICRRLSLGSRMFFVFASLYLLSPQYLFWGRTFMIESTATFFTVASLAAALPLLTEKSVSTARFAVAVTLACLALTIKITTALPALAVFAGCLGFAAVTQWRRGETAFAAAYMLRGLVFLLPFIVAVAWTEFADIVKARNEAGKLLTSDAMRRWTFGWASQRVHPLLYTDVIWNRSFAANAGGALGLAAIVSFFKLEERRGRVLLGVCLAVLFLLPLYTFTHLHYIHHYYQSANTIYLLFLLALSLAFIADYKSVRLFMFAFALVLVSNVIHFRWEGWATARKAITAENNRVLAVANVLKEQSAENKPILVYGLEWSSELPYYAERKAMAVPDLYPWFEEPLRAPHRYLGTADVGALVVCPGRQSASDEIIATFVQKYGPFTETTAYGCKVFVKVS